MRLYLATSLLCSLAAGLSLPSRVVYQFPVNPTWIENIAVRKNGNLLVTLNTSPDIVQIAKPWGPSPTPELVHRFTSLDAVLGITETTADTFVVVGGKFTGVGASIPGTFAAWQVSLTDKEPKATKIVDIPEAPFLNGAVALPWDKNIVLVAESAQGKLYRVNVKAKTYDVVLEGADLEVAPGASAPFGINGVHIRKDFLYFTNSSLKKVFRVRLEQSGAISANATIELFGSADVEFFDDFTLDSKGNAWVVTNFDNKLVVINPDGKSSVVAGSATELTVAGGTAVAFGRTVKDKDILYAVTGGAYAKPVNGTITEPGKIVAFDTRSYCL